MANVLNPTTNAEFIPTIIAQKALGRFAGYMNLAKTVARDFNFTPATEGQTIKVPKRGTVSANAKTAGTEVTKQNPTATSVSVTLDNHWEVTLMIDDPTSVFENQRTIDGYAEDAAIALAEKVESVIAKKHTSLTNTVTFVTSSDATKETSFLTARERLVMNKVPKLEQKFAYLHPTAISKILNIPRFTEYDKTGKVGSITEGAVARIAGIDIFESQLVETSGSPVTYHNLIYTRNAFILAARPLPKAPEGLGVKQTVLNDPNIDMGLRVTWSYDPDLLGMQITLDVLFGVSVLDDRCAVEFESF